jgi:hypothetical protein
MSFDALSHTDATHLPCPPCRLRQLRRGRRVKHCGGQCIASAIAVMTTVVAGVFQAPRAAADFTNNLRGAVMQARLDACGPLRPEPLVDQTAAFAVRSTSTYLNHTARAVPMADPLPVLKDLGFNAGKATLLQGAGKTEADAIKFILVSGYKDIPDCSYAEYGLSTSPNDNPNGYFLTALVLAGP